MTEPPDGPVTTYQPPPTHSPTNSNHQPNTQQLTLINETTPTNIPNTSQPMNTTCTTYHHQNIQNILTDQNILPEQQDLQENSNSQSIQTPQMLPPTSGNEVVQYNQNNNIQYVSSQQLELDLYKNFDTICLTYQEIDGYRQYATTQMIHILNIGRQLFNLQNSASDDQININKMVNTDYLWVLTPQNYTSQNLYQLETDIGSYQDSVTSAMINGDKKPVHSYFFSFNPPLITGVAIVDGSNQYYYEFTQIIIHNDTFLKAGDIVFHFTPFMKQLLNSLLSTKTIDEIITYNLINQEIPTCIKQQLQIEQNLLKLNDIQKQKILKSLLLIENNIPLHQTQKYQSQFYCCQTQLNIQSLYQHLGQLTEHKISIKRAKEHYKYISNIHICFMFYCNGCKKATLDLDSLKNHCKIKSKALISIFSISPLQAQNIETLANQDNIKQQSTIQEQVFNQSSDMFKTSICNNIPLQPVKITTPHIWNLYHLKQTKKQLIEQFETKSFITLSRHQITQQEKQLFTTKFFELTKSDNNKQILQKLREFLTLFRKNNGVQIQQQDTKHNNSQEKFALKFFKLQNYKKCFNILANREGQIEQLNEEEQQKLIEKYYPIPKETLLYYPQQIQYQPQLQFEQEDIQLQLKQLRNHTAPGPSGITNIHLKLLKYDESAIKMLTDAFNLLINNYRNQQDIPELYNFDLIFIPKNEHEKRPIAIQESILNLFHKTLLSKIKTRLSDNQMALQKNSFVNTIKKTMNLVNESRATVVLDIRNAFNSLPYTTLLNGLIQQALPMNVINYITSMVQVRYTKQILNIQAGVAQGDPLSMFCFIASIDLLIRIIEKERKIIAYADDIIVEVLNGETENEVISKMKEHFKQYGLDINQDKCQKYTDNFQIKFLGQSYGKGKNDIFFENIKQNLMRDLLLIQDLNRTGTNKQMLFQIMQKVILPRYNFIPLISQDNKKEWLDELDDAFIDVLSQILNQENDDQFFKNCMLPSSLGGLNLRMPGIYFDQINKEINDNNQITFEEAKINIYNNTRKEYHDNSCDIDFRMQAINQYRQIDNEDMNIILNQNIKPLETTRQCQLCKLQYNDDNHYLKCKNLAGTRKTTHDWLCNLLQRCAKPGVIIDHCGTVPDNNSKLQPDLLINDKIAIDLTIVNPEYKNQAYNRKINKYDQHYEQIIPVVIQNNYKLSYQSFEQIEKYIIIEKFLKKAALVLSHSRIKQRKLWTEKIKKKQVQYEYQFEQRLI